MSKLVFDYAKELDQIKSRFQAHNKLFDTAVLSGIYSIFDEVGRAGDTGIKRLTRDYDNVALEAISLSKNYAAKSVADLSLPLRNAVEQAIDHIREVNLAMLPQSWEKEIRPGTIVGETVRPLNSVGIWIPARKGPLLSTAIMLVTAAKTAGVPNIVVGMPPLKNGMGDPGTTAAAKLAGADQLVVGNGVAIIAGFAQGTESVPETDGIFGPGPGGIAAAMSAAVMFGKRTVVGIGPTECAILADDTADPSIVARDLINEAEHGPDSSALLITPSRQLAEETAAHLELFLRESSGQRQAYLQHVFGPKGKGALIVTQDLQAACKAANELAPEHLMVVCRESDEQQVVEKITHAGEILIGRHTPFSAANYGIGITAVLPTNHFAKAFSGITCKDMVKTSTIGKLSQEALQGLFPIIKEMGEYEQLPAHVKAAEIRLAGAIDQRKTF